MPTASVTLEASPTPTSDFIDIRKSLSPGIYIVYWSQNTWYAKKLGGTDRVQLMPIQSDGLNTEIQLSPDGNLVAFSNTAGRLSIYDLRNGNLESYDNPGLGSLFDIRWASDGRSLWYLGTPDDFPVPDTLIGLYNLSLETGKLTTLIDWRNGVFEYGVRGLNVSEDGRWLAFYVARRSEMMSPNPEFAVYIMDTTCVQNPGTCTQKMRWVGDGNDPAWSPDGRLGWVCAQRTESALCVADVNSSTAPQVILVASDLVSSDGAIFGHFSWSPDGKYIAASSARDQSSVPGKVISEEILIPIAGFEWGNSIGESGHEWCEGWSPESKYLACYRVLGYTEPYGSFGMRSAITDLYVYDIENKTKTDLVDISGEREVFGFFMVIR